MQLDGHLRRIAAHQYVQDLLCGRVVEVGTGDARTLQQLEKLVGERGSAEQRPDATRTELPDGSADVLLALEIEPARLEAVVVEARRVLKAGGLLVLGCESKDTPKARAGAKGGASYFDLVDRLLKSFAAVTMIGQAPFAGTTLVEYGVKDPEPILDGTLVDKGERVEHYIAVAGPKKVTVGGYAVVQLPVRELSREQPRAAEPKPVAAPPPKPAPAPVPAAVPAPVAAKASDRPVPADILELQERLKHREKAVEEAKDAALKHLREMEKVRSELRERDAYIAELETDARDRDRLRMQLERADKRAEAAEAAERAARQKLAQCEGSLRRVGEGGAPASGLPPMLAGDGALQTRVRELEAECEKLKAKEADARSEAWKHLKARSEAEAQAAEVREDTVRKLKDARKLASVELMRAMEEATKKAVGLREELARTERERKELSAEVTALKGQLEAARAGQAVEPAAAPADPNPVTQDLLQAERERGERMLADVEQRARERAEAAVRMKQQAREREREVEALRRELTERDARLIALEQGQPPTAEVERVDAELASVRARLSELQLELERRQATVERAQAAAAHERARAERLVAEERRAVQDRNDARARLAEAESRAAGLQLALERTEREAVRRIDTIEAAVRGEVERLQSMEDALRRAAQQVNGHGEQQ